MLSIQLYLEKSQQKVLNRSSPLDCFAMLNVRLPALIDYLAFSKSVPVHPEEGLLPNPTSRVVRCICSLALRLMSYLHTLFLALLLFSFPLSASPAVIHMLIQGPPAEIRHAEHCAESAPSRSLYTTLGVRTQPFSEYLRRSCCGRSERSAFSSFMQVTAGGQAALKVTQRVANGGRDCISVV